MITTRSLAVLALGLSLPLAGLGGLGCSHEQKAPPVRPTAAPVAARMPAPPRDEPAQAVNDDSSKDNGPAIFFDFDSSLLRGDSHQILQKVATEVRAERTGEVRIEGNCDELGTTEYNLALGEARARAAKTYLMHLGVPDGRVATVSYGAERPKYPGHDDQAHAKNRRDDLVVR
ncbi:MAG TPA: OmpA family protein [Polyangia bacterium]|nr:OmpA family protein [Polyangia bacterium]